MPGRTVVIVNPQSQNGALGRRFNRLRDTLLVEMGPFDHVNTAGPGDATRLCREALGSGADLVVAVGGDGTIHEVANGFFDEAFQPIRPQAALGVLPFGTGGDFRKTADIPKDFAAAARVLKKGARRSIDIGRLDYCAGGRGGPPASRAFINIASFGVGGLVDRIVNQSSKALGGKITFFLASARAAATYKNKRVRLVFDGDEAGAVEDTINNVAVANGRYFGGGMHIAPAAELDDGRFDVVTIGDLPFLKLITSSRRIYAGTHLELPRVWSRRAARMTAAPVDPADEVLLDVDGEAPGALPATFSLLPKALPLVVPA